MLSSIGKYLVAFFVVILAPIHAVLGTVTLLILVDLLTGIWAAKKRGEQIDSSAMRRTISKICVYQVTVVCCFLGETYMLDGSFPLVKLISGAIALVELKSILENGNDITGTDIFKTIIKKLGSQNDIDK